MGVNETILRAQELNNKAKSLNAERLRKLGEKEAAEKTLQQKLAIFNDKYGCEYDVQDLGFAYKDLVAKLNSDVAHLEKMLEKIESGAYIELENAETNFDVDYNELAIEEAKLTNQDINFDVAKFNVDEEIESGDMDESIDESMMEDAEYELEETLDESDDFNFAELAKKTATAKATKFEL